MDNFILFKKLSFKQKPKRQASSHQYINDNIIDSINMIDKHINLPMASNRQSSSESNDCGESNAVYTKESLLKRFTQDNETLDKDLHFEFCVGKKDLIKRYYVYLFFF